MIRQIAATAAFAITLGAPSASAQTVASCDVKIMFGSYAMGIDRPTFERVERLLQHDRRVARSDQQRWGREGEVTICAKVRRRADIAPLFNRIKALFPARPRGPLTVEAGRRRYETRFRP